MVLLPGCNCCDSPCSVAGLQAAIPTIKITYTTTGFSAGTPENSTGTALGVIVRDTGCEEATLATSTTTGAFSDLSATQTLAVGSIPTVFSSYSSAPTFIANGYVATDTLVDAGNGRVHPHAGVEFYCGSQSSWLTSGKYLWAVAFVCKPIYTATTTFSNQFGSPQSWNLRARKGYATIEDGSYNIYGYPPFSFASPPQWINAFLRTGYSSAELDAADDQAVPSYLGQLSVFNGNVPSALLSGGANRWVNEGEIVAKSSTSVNIYTNPRLTYTFAYFTTAPAIVGEFDGGSYTFYQNAVTSGSVHFRLSGANGSFPFVSSGRMSFPDGDLSAYGRFPLFFKQISTETSSPGREFARARRLGVPSCDTLGFTSRNNSGWNFYGQTNPVIPGTASSPNYWSGPTLTASISAT